MKYNLFSEIRLGNETITPNLKLVEVSKNDFKFILMEPYVQVELPPKNLISQNDNERNDITNPKLSIKDWEKTINQWLANGIIGKITDENKSKIQQEESGENQKKNQKKE